MWLVGTVVPATDRAGHLQDAWTRAVVGDGFRGRITIDELRMNDETCKETRASEQ